MIVVSNSTPLIHLGKASKLYFLRELYQQIYIPQAVWQDLMKPVEEGWAEMAMEEAEELGIRTKWVSEILHDALTAGLLKDAKEYEELLEGMRKRGLWITIARFREAVDRAKEIERGG